MQASRLAGGRRRSRDAGSRTRRAQVDKTEIWLHVLSPGLRGGARSDLNTLKLLPPSGPFPSLKRDAPDRVDLCFLTRTFAPIYTLRDHLSRLTPIPGTRTPSSRLQHCPFTIFQTPTRKYGRKWSKFVATCGVSTHYESFISTEAQLELMIIA